MNDELEIKQLDAKVERAKAVLTIVIVAVVNVLNVMGYAMDADPLLNVVGSIASAVTIMYAWWKNQNVTAEATEAQAVLDALKAQHAKAE